MCRPGPQCFCGGLAGAGREHGAALFGLLGPRSQSRTASAHCRRSARQYACRHRDRQRRADAAAGGDALSVARFLWLSGTPPARSPGRPPAGELRPRGLRMHRGFAPPRERPPRRNLFQSTLLHAQRDNLPRDRRWLDRWARPSRTDVRCLFTADLLHRPQCLSPVGGAGDVGMDDQVSAAEGRRDWP